MNVQSYIALAIYLIAYGLIATEKIHRTKIALAGALLMVILGILPQTKAIASIDFNTIFLLMGMMIIVNITRETGLFEFVAIKGVRLAKGNTWRLLITFSIITALFSAILDNVTTVLLLTPIIIFITDTLRVKVFPYLIAIIFAANIGGMSTLIGDPPNIMIGSATGFSFNDFILNMTVIAFIIFLANIVLLMTMMHKQFETNNIEELANLDASRAIKDKKLLVKCLVVLALTITGFFLHHLLELQPATIALSGATLLLLLVKGNPIRYLEKIEWSPLFFFAGLFIMVGGLVSSGIILDLFKWITSHIDNTNVLSISILWGSSIISSFMDNIPFTAMMIPLVQKIAGHVSDPGASQALWWALAIGVNIGGNGTIIAASPNVVVSGIAEHSKHKITFGMYFKYGFISMIMSAVLGTVYLILRYLI